MIQITRTTRPEALDELLPKCVFPEGTPREMFVQQFRTLMTTQPSAIHVLEARSNGTLVGFMIAELGVDEAVWIVQAFSEPSNPRAVIDGLFRRIVLWAVANGRSRILVQTERSADALYRRFGFEEKSLILQHTIDPEVFNRTITAVEKPNGQPVQDTKE